MRAYMKALEHPEFNSRPEVVIWADNCSAQNKNWTLISTLAGVMAEMDHESTVLDSGHHCMQDSFARARTRPLGQARARR